MAGAATQTWVGTTSDWGTASNWSGSVPVAGDTALFNTGTGLAVSLNGSNRSVTSIQFDTNADSFTISPTGSERLLLSSGGNISILASATGVNLTETVSAGLTLGGNYTFTNARADAGTSLVISGNITNSATSLLTISGTGTGTGNLLSGNISNGTGVQSVTLSHTAGTWTVSGSNSYSGLTTVSGSAGTTVMAGSNTSTGGTTLSTASTLQLATTSNGGLASGTLTLTSGTLQAINAARTLSNAVTLQAVTVSGTQSLTLNGKMTGLTGGGRTLTSSIGNGGTLILGAVDINTETANSRNFNLAGTGNTTINGTIANGNGTTANGVSITNTGTTTLNGANTYSGLTTISAGTVILGGSNSGGGNTTFSTGLLQFNSASNGGLASGLLTLSSGTLQAINAARSLSNAISLTASTIIGNQSLSLNGKLTGLSTQNRTLTSSITNGGTLTLSDVDINTETANARTLTIAGTGNTTITGTIANGNGTTANGLSISNTGTTTLSGANTYSGATAITAGTVIFAGSNSGTGAISMATTVVQLNSASNGGLGSGVFSLGSGTLQAINAARTISNATTLTAVTVSGTQNLTLTGKLTSVTNASRVLTSSITGGTLTLGDVDINPDLASARTLTIAGTGNTAITGVIANGGTFANVLAITNTGTTTLSGTSTYTGATTLSAGSRLNVTGALGATAVAVNAGATLGGTGSIGTTTGGAVTVAGGTGAATRGTLDLTDGGIGTLTIQSASGSNALTLGSTTANLFSTLNFETGTNSTDSIAIGNGAKLALNLGGATINLAALTGQTLANGTYNLITYAAGSTFTGAFTLATTESGSTRFLLNNTSTAEQLIATAGAGSTAYWTGAQGSTWDTVSPGTNFSSDAAGTTPTGVPLSTTDVIFSANSGSNLTTTLGQNDFTINSVTFSGSSSASVGGTRTLTLQGSGTNGLTVLAGSGTQTLSTKITLGASQTWVNNSSNNVIMSGTTTIAGGQTLTLNGTNGFSFTTSGALAGAGTVAINSSVTVGNGTGQVGNSGFIGNLVLNSGTLTVSSAGGGSATSMLGTGTLTINGGTIQGLGNIANGTGITGLSSQIWNGDFAQISTSKNLTLGGAISLGTAAGTTRTITVGSTATFSSTGAISDGTTANSLTKAGAGTMRLYGASTFSGTTRIAAGSLQIDANSGTTSLALQNSTVDLNALDTGVLQFGGTFGTATTTINSATFGGLKGSRALSLINTGTGTFASAVALTIGNNNSSQTYSGALSGAGGSVTKVGSGTQIFSGSNTYTGATTVSAGTLLINGSGVSAVQVNAGTLGGTGTISNSVTVADGATVAPGSGGVGTLSTQAFTLSGPTSTLAMEISGTGAGAYDRVNVTGAVNLNGNGQITLSLLSYTPTVGDLLFLVVNDDVDAINGTLFGLAQGTTFSAGGFNWQISYTGDSVGDTFTGGNDLTLRAVPEPQTWALLGCGAMLLLIFRRRAERSSRE